MPWASQGVTMAPGPRGLPVHGITAAQPVPTGGHGRLHLSVRWSTCPAWAHRAGRQKPVTWGIAPTPGLTLVPTLPTHSRQGTCGSWPAHMGSWQEGQGPDPGRWANSHLFALDGFLGVFRSFLQEGGLVGLGARGQAQRTKLAGQAQQDVGSTPISSEACHGVSVRCLLTGCWNAGLISQSIQPSGDKALQSRSWPKHPASPTNKAARKHVVRCTSTAERE